jgi:hypothetical protein
VRAHRVMGLRSFAIIAAVVIVVACGQGSHDPPVLSNRGGGDVAPAVSPARGRFEGTISGHHFSIEIADGKLVASDPSSYAWSVGGGRLSLQDSGPIAEETRFLVARSPRTIVRESDGTWVVTEVVTTAGGRAFTCLHQRPVAAIGPRFEAREVAAQGIAACSSLRIDP